MSEELREDFHLPEERALEAEPELEVETTTDKLGAEGLGTLAQRDMALLKSGGGSGVPGEFGTVDLFESSADSPRSQARLNANAADIALSTPLADNPNKPQQAGEKAGEGKDQLTAAEKAAAEFEQRGRNGLAETLRGLKFTGDGSAPRVLELDEKYTVAAEKSPLELAEDRLGPSASKEQKEHYARMIMYRNDDFSHDLTKKIAAGTVLKMPGQTAEGGVIYKDSYSGTIVTEWQNGSTIRREPDGSGSTQYTTADGWNVDVGWSTRRPQETRESRIKGDSSVAVDNSGLTKEKVWNKTTRDWEVVRFTHVDKEGRTFVGDYKTGDDLPHTVKITSKDKSTVELKPAKGGDYISADGKSGMDQHFNVFSQAAAPDGSVTRTYENGDKEKFDAKGLKLQQEGKDSWGRAYTYDFTPGEKMPHTIKITAKEGEAPVELKRGKGNTYSADLLDAGKTKVGTITLGDDSRLIYKNDKEKTVRTEFKDGTTFVKEERAAGSTITTARAGETLVTEVGKTGAHITETAITSDGRRYTKSFNKDGKNVDGVTIANPDGSRTELAWDKKAEQYRGERKDSTGKVLEKVTLMEDKLVYTDIATGAVRGEKYARRTEDSFVPHFIPGDYERNTGTFTYKNDDGSTTAESFAPGRTDKVAADGTIVGTTVRGDKSSLKRSGEATVEHPDDTGVRLNSNLTIDRWGPLTADNATAEKLAPAEEKFVKDHSDIDKRDVAEIHRRFGGDHTKLESFYKALEKVDTANNLSDAEKSALRKDLMHHVAFPQEIYQGRTPSCNVSVVERDMAMTIPDKYVNTVVQAVSEGEITTSDGKKVRLDPENLKMADSSGRDLASRIFQTTAIQTEFYPTREFRNSEDGVGRLYPSPYNPLDKPLTFGGMTMPHIADVRYKLTGEEKGITQISSVSDLVAAFEANNGQPMIIAVDGNSKPFGGGGPVGKGSNLNHVVTITRIVKGAPPRVYVANQWGLNSDHSSPETAIPGDKLFENMQLKIKQPDGIAKFPGMVLTPGDHTKGFLIRRGKVVEDRTLAASIKKGRDIVPGD